MRKEFLEAGKIVGTHGVKGMVRIQPWSDDADFLSQFKTVYFDGGKSSVKLIKALPHGRITIAVLDGVNSIEDAEKLRNKTVYVKRDDIALPEGRVFVDELIGCSAINVDDGCVLGTVTDVSPTGANDVWHITNNEKEYLLPAIDDVIISIDIDAQTVKIRPIKGIFDDEN